MSSNLIVEHKNNTFSIKLESNDVTFHQQWKLEFIPEIVSKILDQRPSYVVVYDCSNEFEFDPFEAEFAKSVKTQRNGETYLYAGPAKWTEKDIKNIVWEDGFELSDIWFYIPSEDKVNAEIDPIELFDKAFHPLNAAEENDDVLKVECLGLAGDGKYLVWQNSNAHDLDGVKNSLPELSDKYNFLQRKWKIRNFVRRGANVAESVLYTADRFDIRVPTRGANVVNVIDRTVRNARGRPEWIFRFDGPHRGANYNHINVNPAITGIPDPHTAITAGELAAARNAGQALNVINKVAVPLAIAVDTVRVGVAVYEDATNDTTRNTVETAASIAGGWGGGFGGATAGAAIGTGFGTLIGAIVGGVVGGIGGSIGATKITEAIGDELEYDVEDRICQTCQAVFKARFYRGERQQHLCPNCR